VFAVRVVLLAFDLLCFLSCFYVIVLPISILFTFTWFYVLLVCGLRWLCRFRLLGVPSFLCFLLSALLFLL